MKQRELTPKLVDDICKLVELGNYLDSSAVVAGVSPKTANKWFERGRAEAELRDDGDFPRQEEELYYDFYCRVLTAQMVAETQMISFLQEKAKTDGNTHAISWILERTRHERFGKKNKVTTVAGDKDNPVNINLSFADIIKNGAKEKVKGSGNKGASSDKS